METNNKKTVLREFVFSRAGLIVILANAYVAFLIASYFVTGEFLYWLNVVDVPNWAYQAIAAISYFAAFCCAVWISIPLNWLFGQPSERNIVKEQFVFFALAILTLWHFSSDGYSFLYAFLGCGFVFVMLMVLRWEQNKDELEE